jgi:HD-GYP domain-containing protein (c-di-GMP phosphodiesterase class II)/DNA-binding CsgD family transcriptional regulator
MPRAEGSGEGVRVSELVALMSLGADLGLGQPMEHALRQSLIGLRIADRLGLAAAQRATLYYVSLIAWIGCHIDAYEQAKWFGDDIRLKEDMRQVDYVGANVLRFAAAHVGSAHTGLERARVAVALAVGGRREADPATMIANHFWAAGDLADRLGLGENVRRPVGQTFERWDGRGLPSGIRGDEIDLTARIVNLADVVEIYHRAGGLDAAAEVARARRGTQFDPALVDLLCAEGAALFEGLDGTTRWDAVIDAEPELGRKLRGPELDGAFAAVADFADVKSPYTLGHSRGVAELAADAAQRLGCSPDEVTHVRRAALVHDLGRLGISNAVWDKPSRLTAAEEERVRLHPYLTQRMLAGSATLRGYGETAQQHHERLDGSGYPHGRRGDGLTRPGRLLAAADAYHAKLEPRPHRPALAAPEAADWLRGEVRAGRLDALAVDAVLESAGHPVRRRRDWPAGLTTREVEVLRLLARGLPTRQIAERLVISHKTATNHVEHIYTKIGVSNRARAGLFAIQHGLMSVAAAGGSEDGVFAS